MYEERGEFDDSIRLEPVDALAERSPRASAWGRAAIFLIVGGGVLLAVGALAAIVAMIVRIGQFGAPAVVVTAHRDPATLRAESSTVFGKYDAVDEMQKELSGESRQDREAIEALFDKVERCAAEADHDEFKKLVDFDRLLKRMEVTGNMAGWSYFDKRSWRGEAKAMAEAETYWAEITVAGIVAPTDDPNTRVVYAYSNDGESGDPTENRFWLARDRDSWKLYDWARLDLGIAESQEWGLYAKYAESPDIVGFERWGELIGEADTSIASGDYEAAKEKLRRAEAESVPPEFQDFCWVLTGYRWVAIDEPDEGERCYKNVSSPADTPGAYYGQLLCHQGPQPAEALKFAELYEGAVGPGPDLLELKAELFERLGRDDEAAAQWKRLLRIEPDHANALTQFVTSLPIDDASAFEAQLEQLHDPVTAVASIASTVGDEDYERLLLLVAFMNRKAPGTAATLYVSGLTKSLDGQYAEAAQLFREAYEKETDEPKRESYINEYVEAMAADGKVIDGLKSVPDARSASEALYYSYDEGESELTEDDYRQVVAMRSELYPDDIEGMDRAADLAISDERYADAERAARGALERLKGILGDKVEYDDGDNDFYRESLATTLATALYKQDRWKEAYENADERRTAFAQVSRMAVEDERWDAVRALIEAHRAADAEDPAIRSMEGELAAHEKRWDVAARLMRQGLADAVDYDAWLLKQRLLDVYVESGRWLDVLKTSDDQGDLFERLANRFAGDEDWESLEALVAEYRTISPDDMRIVEQEAVDAWHREQYARYIVLAQKLLNSKENTLMGYERENTESRLFSAYLRSRKFDLARKVALEEQRENNDVATLAIVNAASGELAEARRLALETAKDDESAVAFYTNENVGRVFLGKEFSDLHKEFPVNLPHDAANTLAVFVFAEPRRFEAAEIQAAIDELNIEIGPDVEPLESTREESTDAFVLKQGDASVWLAAGEGKYDDGWRLAEKRHTLTNTLESGQGWLAVGTGSWMEVDRKKAKETARRLGASLAGERSVAVYIRGPQSWEITAYPAKPELIAAWNASGNVRSFKDEGAVLEAEMNEAASREFERSLREAVRRHESTPGSRLEVVTCVAFTPQIDPLRLEVKKVRRTHGHLEFDGVLISDSVLIPELRAGLPMQFDSNRIQEVRLNDEEPVRRP